MQIIRLILIAALCIPLCASAKCSASSINSRALRADTKPLHSAAEAIRQAAKSSGGDFSRALKISRYAREIFTETSWLISLLNLHGEMVDQRDKAAVDDLFKLQVEGFVFLLDHTITDINEASGGLRSAGVAVHVPSITERLRNIRKIMAGCA